jgi:hypothetical protein
LAPNPNPQSPIPNPHILYILLIKFKNFKNKIIYKELFNKLIY